MPRVKGGFLAFSIWFLQRSFFALIRNIKTHCLTHDIWGKLTLWILKGCVTSECYLQKHRVGMSAELGLVHCMEHATPSCNTVMQHRHATPSRNTVSGALRVAWGQGQKVYILAPASASNVSHFPLLLWCLPSPPFPFPSHSPHFPHLLLAHGHSLCSTQLHICLLTCATLSPAGFLRPFIRSSPKKTCTSQAVMPLAGPVQRALVLRPRKVHADLRWYSSSPALLCGSQVAGTHGINREAFIKANSRGWAESSTPRRRGDQWGPGVKLPSRKSFSISSSTTNIFKKHFFRCRSHQCDNSQSCTGLTFYLNRN